MANFTLFLPASLKRRMKAQSHIRWSSAIRSIIERKLEDLDEFEHLSKKSSLTKEDVRHLAAVVDASMGRHAKVLLNEARR